jgi:hypothetical protein
MTPDRPDRPDPRAPEPAAPASPADPREPDDPPSDPFLAELRGEDPDADELLSALLWDLVPVEPSPALRERVLGATLPFAHLRRFAAAIAALIDVSVEQARTLIDGLATARWEPGPVRGASTARVAGGAAALGCIRGFGRLAAGAVFPEHEHLGTEDVLVLAGGVVVSDGREAGPGETLRSPAGSRHSFRARAGDDELFYFVVAREGLRFGDLVVRHRDG